MYIFELLGNGIMRCWNWVMANILIFAKFVQFERLIFFGVVFCKPYLVGLKCSERSPFFLLKKKTLDFCLCIFLDLVIVL